MPLRWEEHDALPPEAARGVDRGLGDYNERAAPMGEVLPLGCFVRDEAGTLLGGAVGRTWGRCAELQQLWVDESCRGGGLGSGLVKRFEARAAARGVDTVYLDTFSFQARPFYERLGYTVALEIVGFGDGIAKYTMWHRLVRTSA